jgi:hypothetical protein
MVVRKVVRAGINLHRPSTLDESPSSFGIIYFDNDKLEDDVKKIKTMHIKGECTHLFHSGFNRGMHGREDTKHR